MKMKNMEDLSLSDMKNLGDINPDLANFATRQLAKTYDEFIEILYKDIDNVIYKIQENPELRQKDSEDRVTIDIVIGLKLLGYMASHDSKIGGHTDISVKKSNFLWIGEAKIYRGCKYLWGGFLQLTTRYSTGDSTQRHGGIFLHIQQPNTKKIMEDWKEFLLEKNLDEYSDKICSLRELSFFSQHIHERSGMLFQIRHMPIMLYFNPQDNVKKSK
jgi:hypothetical protein